MEKKQGNKKKEMVVICLLLLALVFLTAGISYAFFQYSKQGTTENTITTGTLTFVYDEKGAEGNRVHITNMLPMSDEDGMKLSGSDHVFHFQITGKTAKGKIVYDIVAEKISTEKELPEDVVKIALTKVRGELEENITGKILDTDSSISYPKYSELTPMTTEDFTSTPIHVDGNERFLYREEIPGHVGSYAEEFHLRMWLSSDANSTDSSSGEWDYNDQSFTVRVNVYAQDIQ